MSTRIIYFVHGTTFDNENHISSWWSDVALSPLGISQSKDLSSLMKDVRLDVVFCSDLLRARETANIAFGGRCPIYQDIRLRECDYGIYNGQGSSIVEPLQRSSIEVPFPWGESYKEVQIRIEDFLEYLELNHKNQVVGIVGHKAPQLALDVILLWKTWAKAFDEDWRTSGRWQPGWEYNLESYEHDENH